MNKLKNKMNKTLLALILFAVAIMASSITVEAKPEKPKGLGLYGWDTFSPKTDTNNQAIIYWTFDNNLSLEGTPGYEVEIRDLKGKLIKTFSSSNHSNMGMMSSITTNPKYSNKAGCQFDAKKMRNKGFKFRVRSFISAEYDQRLGTSAWSDYKVVVARPDIKPKGTKVVNGKVGITWKKVSGAKSYTIYLSTNGGKYKKLANVNAKTTSYTLTNLKSYTAYRVYVQANDVKVGKKKYKSTKDDINVNGVYGFIIR